MKRKNRTYVLLEGDYLKKIYDLVRIDEALHSCEHGELLRSLRVPLLLIQYEAGECVSNYGYLQIVLNGQLSISYIRDDGSAYSLSIGGKNYIIGEVDFLADAENHVIAEAAAPLLTLAIDTGTHRQLLLNNAAFLRLLAETLAGKIVTITNSDAAPSSLAERVGNYIRYKCENCTLSGIEKAAFRLHCSSRQLQRILNKLEKDHQIIKIGKGRYQWIKENNTPPFKP